LGGDKVSFVATARTGAYNVDVATRHTTHETAREAIPKKWSATLPVRRRMMAMDWKAFL
jgi:hypothetical protein